MTASMSRRGALKLGAGMILGGWAMTGCSTLGSRRGKTFSVLDRGAKGDGAALDTAAFQKAIDEAAAAGGGFVLVPKGRKYLCGTMVMKSGVEPMGRASCLKNLGCAAGLRLFQIPDR